MEKKRILIVDDDTDLLSSIQIILEDRNIDVHTASTKREGLDLLKSLSPDLLIQDIMMESDLEGFGILNALKSDPEYRKLPIIMLTGIAEAMEVNFRSAIEDADMFPNVVFLDKPVEPDVLFTEINTLLQ
ncbi:MAG: response regulator [Bacteroidales bacterium]|nr:response regulator [Bacteroidales bacterium]